MSRVFPNSEIVAGELHCLTKDMSWSGWVTEINKKNPNPREWDLVIHRYSQMKQRTIMDILLGRHPEKEVLYKVNSDLLIPVPAGSCGNTDPQWILLADPKDSVGSVTEKISQTLMSKLREMASLIETHDNFAEELRAIRVSREVDKKVAFEEGMEAQKKANPDPTPGMRRG